MENLGQDKNPERQSQVAEEFDWLEKAVAYTQILIDKFESRLHGGLREPSPPPKDANEEKERVVVPIASRIRDSRYAIESTNRRLSDLLERLEI